MGKQLQRSLHEEEKLCKKPTNESFTFRILEFTADGSFAWDQTATEPYNEAYRRRVQVQ